MTDKKDIALGTEDFQKLITSNSYYVDKTKMIEEILQHPVEVFLFPRPRRFGKTLMMSTLENFFNIEKKEENKDLFKGLYIDSSLYKDKQNTYPTIFITLKDLKQSSFQDMLEQFKDLMFSLYNSKVYLRNKLNEAELSKKGNCFDR